MKVLGSWASVCGICVALLGAPVSEATNLWEQNTVTVGLGETWGLFGEIQPRWLDSLSDAQLLIARGAVLYRISPELRIGVGAGVMPQSLPIRRDETRVFQQVDYQPSAAEWIPAYRGRLEQRFLEFTAGALWRIRGKAQLSWMPGGLGAYVWDEVFIHLNGKAGQALGGFDQNRLSFGPRARFGWLTVEAGYLLQTLRGPRNVIRSDHGFVLSAGATFW